MFKIIPTALVLLCCSFFMKAQTPFHKQAQAKLEALKVEYDHLKLDYKTFIEHTIDGARPSKTQKDSLKEKKLQMYDVLDKAAIVRVEYLQKRVLAKELDSYFDLEAATSFLAQPQLFIPENKDRFHIYETSVEKVLQEYHYRDNLNYKSYSKRNNQVVQNDLLLKIIDTIFNQVVFSSNNLVNNASAFGFSQNEEMTTISANANIKIGEIVADYLKVGVGATGRGSDFNLYSRNTWSQSSGATLGGIKQLGIKSLDIKTSYSQEDYQRDKRGKKIAATQILREKHKYTLDYLSHLQLLLDKLALGIEIDEKDSTFTQILSDYPDLKKHITSKVYDKAFDQIEEIKKEVINFLKMDASDDKYEALIKKLFTAYEKEHNPLTTSYNLLWADYNIGIAYTSFIFNDDNIAPGIEPTFTEDREVNSFLLNASANINWSNQKPTYVLYFQGGLGFQSGSLLNSNLIVGTPTIATSLDGDFGINDERANDNNIGNYSDIKESLQIIDANVYGAWFFTKRKNFGFNLSFKHRFSTKEPRSIDYHDNFNLLGGPIFKIADGTAAGTSFGIDIGFENAAYVGNIQDEFTARLRIGIPFNIYTSKKTE